MSEESGQIAKRCTLEDMTWWLDSNQPLPLSPSNLSERFAAQIQIFPGTLECIIRFSAQILVSIFYMSHLDDYKRILETEYPEGWEVEEVKKREHETKRWIEKQLPEQLENLGQRISTPKDYETFYALLENTRRKIIRRQRDYMEFSAQLSFFDEPKKFFRRVNDALGHTHLLSGRGEVRTSMGIFKGVLHGYFRVQELEDNTYAIAE